MGYLESIGAWVLKVILELLLARAVSRVTKAQDDIAQGKIDVENVKRYDEANDRATRIKNALSLLNGDKP